MALLPRLFDAVRSRLTASAESFIHSTERDLRRNREPEPGAVAYARAIAELEQAANKRPPTEEYQDLPVSVWADWSIRTIRSAVQSHVVGQFGQASILVDSMMADDRIQAAANGRIKGVTKCEWNFEPAKSGKLQARTIDKLFPEILDEETEEQLLLWAIFMGFALAEIIWEPKDDQWVPRLKFWHPLYIYYRIDTRRYVAITADQGTVEIEEGDPKWFLYAPWGSYRSWIRGAVRSVSIPWVVRQFALRDWGRFSEVHGLPIKKLMVPSQAPAGDKARFFASVQRLGSESMFSLPQQGDGHGGVGPSFDVQLLEAKDRAWEAFPGLIAQCERSITLAIRGTNLTTEVDGGSFAAANTHKDEDSDYAIADRRKLASAVYKQLLRPFCLYNYGNADLAPKPSLASPESDQEKEATVLVQVQQALTGFEEKGWYIDRKQAADRYGIPIRTDIEPNKPVEEIEAEAEEKKLRRQKMAEQLTLPGTEDDKGKPGDDGGTEDVDRESRDTVPAAAE